MDISLEDAVSYSSLFAFAIYWFLVADLWQKLEGVLCPPAGLQSSVFQTIMTNLSGFPFENAQ